MRIDFACGHTVTAPDDYTMTPECPSCHDRRVVSVKVRPPRFTGTCCGPCATFDPTVTATKINLATGGPLKLKDVPHGDG